MLYLASASPRRARLLKEASIRFKVLISGYHERGGSRTGPARLVKKHAMGKALAASAKVREGNVLAADTVVYFRGKIIGKPARPAQAVSTLLSLQGRWHTVYTGVAFLRLKAGRIVQKNLFFEKTKVLLGALDEKGVRAYFRRVNPMDKAGSYAIQSGHGGLVKDVRGSFSNAVGLPMERLTFL